MTLSYFLIKKSRCSVNNWQHIEYPNYKSQNPEYTKNDAKQTINKIIHFMAFHHFPASFHYLYRSHLWVISQNVICHRKTNARIIPGIISKTNPKPTTIAINKVTTKEGMKFLNPSKICSILTSLPRTILRKKTAIPRLRGAEIINVKTPSIMIPKI